MAAGEHSWTRRTVLGAVVAMPLFRAEATESCHCPLSQAEEGIDALREWVIALSAFCWAEADLKALEGQEAFDDRFSEFATAADAAMLRLLGTAAPNVHALALKIALIADHRPWELSGGEGCLAMLETDARRLAAAHG